MKLQKRDNYSLSVEKTLSKGDWSKWDVYLFVPTDKPLSSFLRSESTFYLEHVEDTHHYSVDQYIVPLLKSQFNRVDPENTEKYRSRASLFAHHFNKTLNNEMRSILSEEDDEALRQRVTSFSKLLQELLFKFRRKAPHGKHLDYAAMVDNYLSWHSEQALLEIVHKLPKKRIGTELRDELKVVAQLESDYRAKKGFNSKSTVSDPTKLANKMRLIGKLIEQPIILSRISNRYGESIEKMVKASSTGLVMLLVMAAIFYATAALGYLSLTFIGFMAVIYGIREWLKDDLRDALWRFYSRNKPKWSIQLRDNLSHKRIGRKLLYVDFLRSSELPDKIKQARNSHRGLDEQVICLQSDMKLNANNYNDMFDKTIEQRIIDLSPFLKLVSGKREVRYELVDGQTKPVEIERRSTLNVVTSTINADGENKIERYKVLLNRKKIIDISRVV
ncbi:hypothetical protein [Vibrio mediterranei]|uniref:hypothetical protein n=1 Tax=Vibrio mediterranei TaxID=689 RepID=UPI0040694054